MPHNPGLSEKAWQKLHVLMARFILKYSGQISKGKISDNKNAEKAG